MRVIIGNICWVCLLRRESLCLLDACYKFATAASNKVTPLWKSVIFELDAISAILPLLQTNNSSVWHPTITCSDASLFGIGNCIKRESPEVLGKVGRCCERWRYKHSKSIQAWLHSLEEFDPEIVDPVGTCVDFEFSEVPETVFEDAGWKTVHAARVFGDHSILHLEALALLFWAKHTLRNTAAHGRRVLSLVDNLALCLAVTKGRSGSPHLVTPLRNIAAFLLATGTILYTRWVPSERNFSDKPSRRLFGFFSQALFQHLAPCPRPHTLASYLPPLHGQAREEKFCETQEDKEASGSQTLQAPPGLGKCSGVGGSQRVLQQHLPPGLVPDGDFLRTDWKRLDVGERARLRARGLLYLTFQRWVWCRHGAPSHVRTGPLLTGDESVRQLAASTGTEGAQGLEATSQTSSQAPYPLAGGLCDRRVARLPGLWRHGGLDSHRIARLPPTQRALPAHKLLHRRAGCQHVHRMGPDRPQRRVWGPRENRHDGRVCCGGIAAGCHAPGRASDQPLPHGALVEPYTEPTMLPVAQSLRTLQPQRQIQMSLTLRHGGASHDLLYRIHSLEAVQRRGRWASSKSLRRYGKETRPIELTAALPKCVLRPFGALMRDRLVEVITAPQNLTAALQLPPAHVFSH